MSDLKKLFDKWYGDYLEENDLIECRDEVVEKAFIAGYTLKETELADLVGSVFSKENIVDA